MLVLEVIRAHTGQRIRGDTTSVPCIGNADGLLMLTPVCSRVSLQDFVFLSEFLSYKLFDESKLLFRVQRHPWKLTSML